ncbi:MAG: S24 family peptidase [Candidatus Gastranaerophilales bacterium]|nr:S24 family peptidase [Candidatus Gastranaerophilales bacterium]
MSYNDLAKPIGIPDIFAFRFNGECFVKEICLLGKRVMAIPLNKEYEPFFIEETDDVEILGRVVPMVRL